MAIISAHAQEADSSEMLQEVVVSQLRKTVRHKGLDAVISTDGLATARGSFGEPDVISMLKRMPGVSSISDLGSGLSVDGADFSQIVFDIDGTPVYFPFRPIGVFSAFNPRHYAKAVFERMPISGRYEPRLGAVVSFLPYQTSSRGVTGQASVGLLSSSLAMRANVADRWLVSAAARVSYIEKVYGRTIKNDAGGFSADFYDFNLSAIYSVDSLNQLSVNVFRSQDKLIYANSYFVCDMDMLWHNNLVNVKWRHGGAVKSEQSLYFTSFDNRFSSQVADLYVCTPSSLQQYGLQGCASIPVPSMRGSVDAGYSVDLYRIEPMWVKCIAGHRPTQLGMAARLYSGVRLALSKYCTLEGVLSVIYWYNGHYNRLLPSPRLSLRIERDIWCLTIRGALAQQYLHRVGFAEIGAATDFWFGAYGAEPVQSALGVSFEYTRQVTPNLSLTAGAYCRRVKHQSEYVGTVFDLLDQGYDYKAHIVTSDGYNVGVSLAAEYSTRTSSLSVAYNYGMARRKFGPGLGYRYSNTDPGHSLKFGLESQLSSRWIVTADFTLASGRRYTPIEQLYLISSNIIAVYGERNSSRLPLYHRLDLGARYKITRPGSSSRIEQSLAFGLLNAYGSNNIESRYYGYSIDDNSYKRYDKGSLYRFLPSVSYTIKF